VLICDEPTSSLDVSVQSQIVNLLLDAGRARDLSMLFVTHDLDLIGRVVETVAVMYGGRIVEIGPAEQIRQSPRHHYTKALHDAVPADDPRNRRLASGAAIQEPALPDAANGQAVQLPAGQAGAELQDSCVFAGRCPSAQERCRQERPPMIEEDGGRSYACFYPI
jgi:oligopeptide/dipeptide ABC transporter ATP-binding protein